jgi:hypothetical protein
MSKPVSPEDGLPDGLSQPARRALVGAGYLRIEQLASATEEELMGLHGMGPRAMDLLRKELKAHNLSFARNQLAGPGA